ncbi:hypothetical protein Vretimale_8902 [Volvox reticuliferus]|uniref:Uncharacterized protein n=1 Tax=Volvox reticuliferus TaxID=1737510 RepID=A0A8J4FRG5_9CHLO|nr:hypothetical protein Vretifemale_14398 [Volvox reticuliferus]GIM04325.1 hypothetical protein Vretimale_8902 [Volvox reticuliferus]
MLTKAFDKAARCADYARGQRSLSIPRALAAQAPPSSTPSPGLLAASLAAAPPVDRGPLPLSYRTVTTDPVFRPLAGSTQQYAPGPPQLLSRYLTLNPLHGLAAWASALANRIDLDFAARMDRAPLTHLAAAAATATLTYLGLHPLSLLRFGLPAAAADWLEAQLGGWLVSLAGVVAVGVGAAAALWQLRNWVAAQSALLRFDSVIGGAAGARDATIDDARIAAGSATRPSSSGASPSSDAGADPAASWEAGPFLGLVPAQWRGFFEGNWKSTDRTWLLLIMAGRLSTLLIASSSVLLGTTASTFAALCFGVSLAPLALPHIRQLLAASVAARPPFSVPGGSATLAAAIVLADAAFLLALALPPPPPLVRGLAAVALAAGSGLAAMAAAASSRLAASRAAAGDVATFHVVVRLPTSGTLIDTTCGHQPLTARVGNAAAADDPSSAEAGTPAEAERDPQARFRPLQALLAATELEGMYLGERRTAILAIDDADASSTGLPFRNPGLVWWQPLDDLNRKVGSGERALRAGDVFWYPVGSLVVELGARRLSTTAAAAAGSGASALLALAGADSWGPVEVCAVSKDWVQLDANAGLQGGQAEVEVQLVALEKRRRRLG